MLRFLTDSHVPPAVCSVSKKIAAIDIIALKDWHGGRYLDEADPRLLSLAWEERRTIVTYDLNSFPMFVRERLEASLNHAGMVYVSARFRQNEIGAIARALAHLWRAQKTEDWTNRIFFLER